MLHWREMSTRPNQHAQRLFDSIVAGYELLAELFSFFQYGRWRRFLVSRMDLTSGERVLDLCTGPGGVALALARRFHSRVVGVDLSPEMVLRARQEIMRRGLKQRVMVLQGRAEELPFLDDCFDAVCFTFLFRYVQEPEETLREVVRVLRPGGCLASLEFGVPESLLLRTLWRLYTHAFLPVLTYPLSSGWRRVGAFLGPSISRFYRAHTIAELEGMWKGAGIECVQTRRLSLGGAVVMWGRKIPVGASTVQDSWSQALEVVEGEGG